MAESRGRGRPKIDQTAKKREILKVTVTLFSQKGYSVTNIQEVADHMGMAKGTLYLYFKNKEELFLSAVEYAIESLAEYIDTAIKSEDTPLEKVKAFIAAFITFVQTRKSLASMIVQEGSKFKSHADKTYFRIYSENSPQLEKIIEEGVSEGTFRELDPSETTKILVNLLSGTMYSQVLGGSSINTEPSIKKITEFLLLGMLKKAEY